MYGIDSSIQKSLLNKDIINDLIYPEYREKQKDSIINLIADCFSNNIIEFIDTIFDNAISYMTYYNNGKIHRENDKPATIKFMGIIYHMGNYVNMVEKVEYYINGNLHRENNKPSVLVFSGDLNIKDAIDTKFYNHGILYKKISRVLGDKFITQFYKNNIIHNDTGAAYISWKKINHYSIEITNVSFYKNGEYNNICGGPDEIFYNNNKISSEHYNKKLNYYQNSFMIYYFNDNDNDNNKNDNDNKIRYIEYYKHLNLHREDDKPSTIYYDLNGNIIKESYYYNGKLHRKNNPAIIEYDLNGNIIKERYYYNDKLHRENDPAIIEYNSDKNIISEMYYYNGEIYRKNDPVIIEYDSNKNIIKEIYCYNGELYKKNDLAIIEEEYFNKGIKV